MDRVVIYTRAQLPFDAVAEITLRAKFGARQHLRPMHRLGNRPGHLELQVALDPAPRCCRLRLRLGFGLWQVGIVTEKLVTTANAVISGIAGRQQQSRRGEPFAVGGARRADPARHRRKYGSREHCGLERLEQRL